MYDTQTDPHEVKNLADSPEHQKKLKELCGALDKWIEDTKDLGDIPETELIRKGLVRDVLSDYFARIKKHPKDSKASPLPPAVPYEAKKE